MRLILKAIIFMCFITFCLIVSGIFQPERRADAAIIFGTTVYPSGKLSERLESRVQRGLELYNSGKVRVIIVSGGLGREGHYEGDKMRDYLLARGVPPEDIIVDNAGNTTALTAVNSYQMSQKTGISSVIAVSQYFHVARCKMALKKAGFTDVQGASPRYTEARDIYSVPREMIAFYAYLVKKL